jgi:hypothetical protein
MFGLRKLQSSAIASIKNQTRSLTKQTTKQRKRRSLIGQALESRRVLANYIVNTASDVVQADGMLSLREAIQAANTNAAVNADTVAGDAAPGVVDTISFAAGLTEIILTSELTLSDSVTVSLGAASEMTLNGNNAHRIFSIVAGTNTAVANDVTLSGLRLIGGAAASGGAVRVASGQSLTLNSVTFENNLATGNGATAGGGALFNDGGEVTIVDSTFTRNAAAGVATLSLTGAQQNPPVTTSASGSGYLVYNSESDTVSINALITGLELTDSDPNVPNITIAHIHRGATGVNGPVIIDLPLARFSTEAGGVRLQANNLTVPAAEIANLLSGALYVNIHSSVNGGGEIRGQITLPTVMGSGGAIFNSGGTLNVTDTALNNNVASRAGGAIESTSGTVVLTGVTMRNNVAGPADLATPGNGGAVHVSGATTVSVIDSTIGANTAALEGGGLWNSTTGTLDVQRSTASGNTAQVGGGIFGDGAGGTINVTNSTIAANTSNSQGGGIAIEGGNLNLKSVTIARNTADAGGGLHSTGGTITAINTILALNTATTQTDGSGNITSTGNNLFGTTAGITLSGAQTGDVVNVDPMLEALADNGGPTRTIALMTGSPALSAGIADGLTVDQRGLARRQGADVDIGAFESALAAADDPPTVSVTAAAASVTEGNTGTTATSFTVTRTGRLDSGFTVNYAITPAVTAGVSADDFAGNALPSGTVTFAANETTQTITINVAADTTFEPDEVLIVTLSGPTGDAVIGQGTATATITNDDTATVAVLAIAADQANRVEGSTGTTPYTFIVTRSGVTTAATTADFRVTGSGTNPANASDFPGAIFADGSLSFAANQTSIEVTIVVAADTIVEPDETFTVTLANASGGALISTATAIGTIVNDDVAAAVPNFAIAATNATRDEGNTAATAFTFTVTRSNITTGADSIAFEVDAHHGADPASPDDFVGGTFASGTIDFADGETTKVITIEVSGDTEVEEDEEFEVTLSSPTRSGIIVTSEASGTITNDDIPPPALVSITAANAATAEGDAGTTAFTFTITRSSNFSDLINVRYAVTATGTNAAEPADFENGQLPSGTIVFAAGQMSQTLSIPVAADTVFEPDQDFTVTLSNLTGNATLGIAAANGTIRNDDQPPTPKFEISVATGSALEGNSATTPLTFTVTRLDNTLGINSVDFAVIGSGTSPATENDFVNNVFAGGTVTFGPTEVTKTITIEVSGDQDVELDETFTIQLSNPTGTAIINQASAIGTIRNDDVSATPVISIVAVDAEKAEGNNGLTPFTFTISRAGNTQGTSSVRFAVSEVGNGSALGSALSTDFENGSFPSGTVTFADGASIQTVTINVVGETEFETDESFNVTLTNPSGPAILGSAIASGLILNDDRGSLPQISIVADAADSNEGNAGSTPFTFTVRRSVITTGVTSVPYAITGSGNDPVMANDFVGSGFPMGIVRFENGETSKTITVDIAGDTAFEPNESFLVTLANPVEDFELTTATATGTVRNDDATPQSTLAIAATSADKNEGNSGNTSFTFTVTRTLVTTGQSTVNYAVAQTGDNPASAIDFQGGQFPTGSLTFADGEATKVITVSVVGDTIFESEESFVVTLSGASAGTQIQVASALGSIDNDDTSPFAALSIASASAEKNEGQSGITDFTFTVTRAVNTAGVTMVDYTVSGPPVGSGSPLNGGANESDFVSDNFPSGTITFEDGETTKTITIGVKGDTTPEADETFVVTLSGASGGASIATATSSGVIRDDDPATTFAIAAAESVKLEGNSELTALTFTVTRSVNLVGAATIDYLVSDNSGVSADAEDFLFGVFPSGTLTFLNGESSKTITINVAGDRTVEPDELFDLTLSNPSGNSRISTAIASGTIRNDDSAATALVSIAVADASKDEGDEGTTSFQFTIVRSANLDLATTMNFAVAGIGTDPAEATDFVGSILQSGVINFAVGESSKTITVDVRADTEIEADESFQVVLSNVSAGSSLVTAAATGSIRNDDNETIPATLAIAAADAAKDEGNTGVSALTFTVTRSGNPTVEVTVNYSVTGTATEGASASDFVTALPSGTITFASGVTTQTITINVNGDTEVEPNESFLVTLDSPNGSAMITTGSATGVIRNDDMNVVNQSTLSIAATNATRNEGNTGQSTTFTFTVTRTGNTDGISTANYDVMGSGTNAANATDFGGTFPRGTVTFAPGVTSQEIAIIVSGDVDFENNDTFTVTLNNPSVNTIIGTGSATGTITNDDSRDGGGGGGGNGGVTDPNTRIFIPITVDRAHFVARDVRPSAIIFRAVTDTIVSIVPIGLADASDLIRVVNDDLGSIGRYENGIFRVSLMAGELYAALFAAQTEDRLYSIESSAGSRSLSNSPGTNILIPTDVDLSGQTTPLDALIVMNSIRRSRGNVAGESASSESVASRASTMLDVDRDGKVTPIDALKVINYIRRRGAGESSHSALVNRLPAIETPAAITKPTLTTIDSVITNDELDQTVELSSITAASSFDAVMVDSVIEDQENSIGDDTLAFVSEDVNQLSCRH